MKLAVKTLENKEVGDITLDADIFGIEPNVDAIQKMVVYQLDRRQSGTHKTKRRGEIARTGKKPFGQKGTGNARAGTYTRNIDRGGAVAHGPRIRSHATELPKRIRRLAMMSVLSVKAKEGKLIILDDAKATDHKTKPMAAVMKSFDIDSAVIVGGQEIDANFARATANLPKIDVVPAQGANVYDIMRRDILVMTKEAVETLTQRLKG